MRREESWNTVVLSIKSFKRLAAAFGGRSNLANKKNLDCCLDVTAQSGTLKTLLTPALSASRSQSRRQ
jgi:hypothetical protein